MRVFVYEWSCCVLDAAPSMRIEGWAMVSAVLQDFQLAPEIETVTLIHEDFPFLPPGEVQRIRSAPEEKKRFRDLAAGADATLVIAPETDNLLLDRVRWVEQMGGFVLGPNSAAIALTGDKAKLAKIWSRMPVPTPAVRKPGKPGPFPAVLKPRDGAGSQTTFLVQDEAEVAACLEKAAAEGARCDFILQKFVPGQAASIAFLFGGDGAIELPSASQRLSKDGHFHYLGGSVPLPYPLHSRALRIGFRALESIPGLRGFVGVDLVLGPEIDSSADWVIEINPRLTTSYLGLRKLCYDNLALAMLRLALGEDIEPLRWRKKAIRFAPGGGLET